jgi:GntR family transcriptional regulator, rspAB operon transcriptional repressor
MRSQARSALKADPVALPAGFPAADLRYSVPSVIAADIARVLSDAIIFLEYEPGFPIREEEVSAKFGVSRSPVREAFRMLEADGLVRRLPRRGVRVGPMSRADLDEVYACRVALEGLVAAEAARRSDKATVLRLKSILAEMRQALRQQDVMTFFHRNVAFTRAIHYASGNSTLIRILDGIEKQALRYRYLAHRRTFEMLELSLDGQTEVLAAIADRKPLLARRRAERLILRARDVIAEALSEAYPTMSVQGPVSTREGS